MTDMKRITISVPDDIAKAVYEMRKEDRFTKCSYSEIIRQLVSIGLKSENINPKSA